MTIKHIKIKVSEEAHREFKIAVTRLDLTMQDYLEEAIYKAIGKKRPTSTKL